VRAGDDCAGQARTAAARDHRLGTPWRSITGTTLDHQLAAGPAALDRRPRTLRSITGCTPRAPRSIAGAALPPARRSITRSGPPVPRPITGARLLIGSTRALARSARSSRLSAALAEQGRVDVPGHVAARASASSAPNSTRPRPSSPTGPPPSASAIVAATRAPGTATTASSTSAAARQHQQQHRDRARRRRPARG
jgi:hypothetical protein